MADYFESAPINF